MADSPVPPSKSITDALRSAETDPRRPNMTTEINAVALERCCSSICPCAHQREHGMESVCETCKRAALASAQPAQAGEYEGLAKALRKISQQGGIHGGAWCAAFAREALNHGKARTETSSETDEGSAEGAEAGMAETYPPEDPEARVKALTAALREIVGLTDIELDFDGFEASRIARAALASSDAAPEHFTDAEVEAIRANHKAAHEAMAEAVKSRGYTLHPRVAAMRAASSDAAPESKEGE